MPFSLKRSSIWSTDFGETPFVHYFTTVTSNPAFLASKAVFPTQKSSANPTIKTSATFSFFKFSSRSVGFFLVPKPLYCYSSSYIPFLT